MIFVDDIENSKVNFFKQKTFILFSET